MEDSPFTIDAPLAVSTSRKLNQLVWDVIESPPPPNTPPPPPDGPSVAEEEEETTPKNQKCYGSGFRTQIHPDTDATKGINLCGGDNFGTKKGRYTYQDQVYTMRLHRTESGGALVQCWYDHSLKYYGEVLGASSTLA